MGSQKRVGGAEAEPSEIRRREQEGEGEQMEGLTGWRKLTFLPGFLKTSVHRKCLELAALRKGEFRSSIRSAGPGKGEQRSGWSWEGPPTARKSNHWDVEWSCVSRGLPGKDLDSS